MDAVNSDGNVVSLNQTWLISDLILGN